jgi:hypothetical protein
MAMAWKLLGLIAALLMPLGMTAAPAAAAQHHGTAASMPMEHCPDQDSKAGSKAGFAQCTMACSAALPATDLGTNQPMLIVCTPTQARAAHRLQGLHPETATPPPKLS